MSTTVSVSPPDETPPEQPDPFDVVLAGPTTVRLQWGASTDNVGITGYRLTRNGAALDTPTVSSTSLEDASVVAGETYVYALSASDAAGNWSEAVTGSITVPVESEGSPPTTPGVLRRRPARRRPTSSGQLPLMTPA